MPRGLDAAGHVLFVAIRPEVLGFDSHMCKLARDEIFSFESFGVGRAFAASTRRVLPRKVSALGPASVFSTVSDVTTHSLLCQFITARKADRWFFKFIVVTRLAHRSDGTTRS